MAFRTYDYRCLACGQTEERMVRAEAADDQTCVECTGRMKRLVSAPRLDITGMANAGCPGAHETVGNRLEKQHRSVDQLHRMLNTSGG